VLKKTISAVFLFALVTFFSGIAQAEVPEWLRALSKQPPKTYADDVNAVVLLDDIVTTVKENGDLVRHGRRALRILRPEGRTRAAFYAREYNADSKVNYLHGWSITSKGQEYETKSGDILEHNLSTYEVYSDAKEKAVVVPGADVGTVVGFEYEEQERPYVFHDTWEFQESQPVERSRYELHLASGWRFKSEWMNHKEEKPVEESGALQWQISDIPRIEDEYNQPDAMALAGRMVVTFFSEKLKNHTFRDWNDLGAWEAQLIAGSRDSNPSLQQKVLELAPPNLPALDRIKTLARFAQHDSTAENMRLL